MLKIYKQHKEDATRKTKKTIKTFHALALIRREKVCPFLEAFLDTTYMKNNRAIFEPFIN